MRILFLTSRLPYPPDRGDRLRVFNFIQSLAEAHDIHLVSFISDSKEENHISTLETYCQSLQVVPMSRMRSAMTVGLNIWRDEPFQALYYRSSAMHALIQDTLTAHHFDAAYIHLFRMAPYLKDQNALYRIVDLTDVISQEIVRSMPYRGIVSKTIYALERPRIERYERWVAQHFEETWLISEHDGSILKADCPQANIQVVRNGVDIEKFHPIPGLPKSKRIVFVGHMGVFHNIDAAIFLAEKILPGVRAEIPDTELKIVGASPVTEVQALGKFEGVEVTGFVEDLNEVLNESTVFVAPLRFAAGVQNKVLEAMAAGSAVVTTSLVNQGLGAQPGQDLLIADSAADIVAAVLRLFKDRKLCENIEGSARCFVQNTYRWDFVVEQMKVVEEHLVLHQENE